MFIKGRKMTKTWNRSTKKYENMSVNQLEHCLILSGISKEVKKEITNLIKIKMKEIDQEVYDYQHGKKGILDYYSDMNPLWRLAKFQLYNEGNPNFLKRGRGRYIKIVCDETGEDAPAICDMMKNLTKWGNYNKSLVREWELIKKEENDEYNNNQ